jgi:gas vesicle protein
MLKLLTGLLAGIVIGILIAPDSGTATRQRLSDLKDKGRDLIEGAGDKLDSLAQEGSQLLNTQEGGGTPSFRTDTANNWSS